MKYEFILFFLSIFFSIAIITLVALGKENINNSVNSATSPNLSSDSDLCVIPVTGAIQSTVIGLSAGKVYDSIFCQNVRLSKILTALGLRDAALSLLAQNDARVFDALWQSERYPPIKGKTGLEAKAEWEKPENQNLIPKGSKIFPKPIEIEKSNSFFATLGLLIMAILIFI